MQRRGDVLIDYLAQSLRALHSEYAGRGNEYIYSQKELAAFSGVSRETVRKHQVKLDEFLSVLYVSKRSMDKNAHVSNLKERILKIENDLARVTLSYESLRLEYLHIISVLVRESLDISKFVIRGQASGSECPICHHRADSHAANLNAPLNAPR